MSFKLTTEIERIGYWFNSGELYPVTNYTRPMLDRLVAAGVLRVENKVFTNDRPSGMSFTCPVYYVV